MIILYLGWYIYFMEAIMKKYIVIILIVVIVSIVGTYLYFNRSIKFTEEEKAWMDQHPVIFVAPDPTFGPVEYLTDDHHFEGLAMDYLEWIEDHIPIDFELVEKDNWSDIIDAIKNKEIDMLSAAVMTEERLEYLAFSEAFYKIRFVILTRRDFKGKVSFDDLLDEDVIVIEDYAIEDYLKASYPEINRIPVKIVEDGISKLSLGAYDYMSASLAQISYYLDQNNTTNLKVSGDVDLDQELRFAVRDDYEILTDILNKALKGMPKKEKDDIYAKWINVGLIEGISPQVFYSVVAVSAVILLVILVVIVFNRMLKDKVNQKTLALNAELKERKRIEKELAYLNNTLEQKVEMRTCELKSALDNLKTVQSELIESEKMVSLGKITLTMAHRLNTPIGSAITINSYNSDLTTKLEKSLHDDQLLSLINDMRKSNEMISSELNNAKRYIDQMKKVSDFKAEGPKQDVKLLGYLMLLLNSYEGIFKEHHIEVNLSCKETVSLYASSNSLDCIFNNLIDNSLRHAFLDRDKGRIDIDIIEEDDIIEINYADDGIGLSEDLISDILSPMVTRNMGQNNGFGLNILYNIVKFELNGSLDVKSTSSHGVTFKIKIKKNNASS